MNLTFSPVSTSSSVKIPFTPLSAYNDFLKNISPFKALPFNLAKSRPREKKKKYKDRDFQNDVLVMKIKLQKTSSPKKCFKVNRQNIKPFKTSHPLVNTNSPVKGKYLLTLKKNAVFRPYIKNIERAEIKELSCSEKINYWRRKTLEQYKISRNVSLVRSGIRTEILRSRLTPTVFRGSFKEVKRETVKYRGFKMNDYFYKGLDLNRYFRLYQSKLARVY